MRFKIIAVNVAIVLLVGLLSFVIVRSALVNATSNQETLSADAKRDVQGAAAKFQLDALRAERWVRAKASEPGTTEPMAKASPGARGEAATKRCDDLINQTKSNGIFEGNGPTFAAMVDTAGKIVGRNGTSQSRGEDINASYPGLKSVLAGGGPLSEVAAGEKHLASYAPVTDEQGKVIGVLMIGMPLNDMLSRVSDATTGRPLALVDPANMQVAAKSGNATPGFEASIPHAKDTITRSATSRHADVMRDGDLLLAASSLDALGDGKHAVLVAGAPSSLVSDATALSVPVLGATALGILFVVIAGWLLGNYITRPIGVLEEGLLAILNGQADKRFELEHAELGGLAFRIDQLLNQLMGVEEDTTDAEGRVSRPPRPGDFNDAMAVDDKRMEGEGTLDPEAVSRLAAEPANAYYARIYREYIAAKKNLGEPTDHITEQAFATRIQGMEREAAAKHGKPVRYQVQARNREVVLLAIPLP